MIRVVAISPEDGWAFVEEDGALFQVRPPYRRDVLTPGTEAEIMRSIGQDGFEASDRQFPSWGEVVRFLREEIRRSRPDDVSRDGQRRELRRFLENADERVIEGFLDRIENEYLSKGNYALAQRAIGSMLESDRVQALPAQWRRATQLWNHAAAQRPVSTAIDFPSISPAEVEYCRRLQPDELFSTAA
ncbi:MAG: hypothetical protein ACKV22_12430 [Bryobacteraceae bacterium]